MKWISLWLAILVLVFSMAAHTKKNEAKNVESASSSAKIDVSEKDEPELGPLTDVLAANIVPGWEGLHVADIYTQDSNMGYITSDGEVVLKGKYLRLEKFTDGLAVVTEGALFEGASSNDYFINAKGEKQFGTEFLSAYSVQNGIAVVRWLDDSWYMIDIKSGAVTPLAKNIQHIYIGHIEGMLQAEFMIDGEQLYGFYDESGTLVIEPKYTQADMFSEGLAAVEDKESGHLMYIDKTGKVVLDTGKPVFSIWYAEFSEGLACVDEGYIDKTGKLIFAFSNYPQLGEHAYGYRFRDGLALVSGKDGDVFIDKKGKIKIDLADKYICNWGFSEGLAAVISKETSKIGFIDTQGQFVTECIYRDMGSENHPFVPDYIFEDGITRVVYVEDSKQVWACIDTSGKEVYKCYTE